MAQPSVPFEYPKDDGEDSDGANSPIEIRTETLRRLGHFIGARILTRRHGKLPSTRTIAARLVVLNALLYPEQFASLASVARELGCTSAWLSKIAYEFSDSIGMRAPWQRHAARTAYATRAKGVHAGTWKATSEGGKWERRKLREARRKRKTKANG